MECGHGLTVRQPTPDLKQIKATLHGMTRTHLNGKFCYAHRQNRTTGGWVEVAAACCCTHALVVLS